MANNKSETNDVAPELKNAREIIDNMSEQELNDFVFFALQEMTKKTEIQDLAVKLFIERLYQRESLKVDYLKGMYESCLEMARCIHED